MRKPNFLKTAESTLPVNGRKLTHLNLPAGQPARDPTKMAEALKDHWEPLWSRPHPAPTSIQDYLAGYNEQIGRIPHVTLETVLEVLSRRRDSSTGPDGIPFSIYRALADIVAPPWAIEQIDLLSSPTYSASLRTDRIPVSSRLRPISVSNTDCGAGLLLAR